MLESDDAVWRTRANMLCSQLGIPDSHRVIRRMKLAEVVQVVRELRDELARIERGVSRGGHKTIAAARQAVQQASGQWIVAGYATQPERCTDHAERAPRWNVPAAVPTRGSITRQEPRLVRGMSEACDERLGRIAQRIIEAGGIHMQQLADEFHVPMGRMCVLIGQAERRQTAISGQAWMIVKRKSVKGMRLWMGPASSPMIIGLLATGAMPRHRSARGRD